MYRVTKSFIYRARLYPIGHKLTERQYTRMMRDKVAIRRGIPEMVALHSPTVDLPVKEDKAKSAPEEKVVAKKPAPKKKAAAKKPAPEKKAAAKKPAPKKKATAKPKKE